MPPNSEIEKLERRWRDNPKGTVFAPYAEVLRKNGDHAVAREVLRQGLELHPDHIPGNIVLGRCCLDLGEDGPAEAAFAHVLDLDSENVIALKALGDITERQGRLAEANDWLSRLISVDPSNDEARDQLARVTAAREAAAAALAAEFVPREESPAALSSAPTVDLLLGSRREPAPATEPPDRAEAGVGEIDDIGDVAAFADEALDSFLQESARKAPLLGHGLRPDEGRAAPLTPVLPSEPTPIAGLEPAALDLSEAAAGLGAEPLAGLEVDEAPAAAGAAPPARPDGPTVSAVGVEETAAEIDLRPTGATESQSADDSTSLLELSAGKSEFEVADASADLQLSAAGKSEFQTPDASEDLKSSTAGSTEYQTPSGAEELLQSARDAAGRAHEPQLPVEGSSWGGAVLPSTFAALAAMPTQELSTEPPPPPPRERPPSAPSWLFEDEEPTPLAPAPDTTLIAPEPEPEPEPEAVTAASTPPEPEAEPEPVAATARAVEPAAELTVEAAPRSSAELKLIFPDDAAQPEPHRVRRITQTEVTPPTAEETPEPVVGEPEPIMTETMAELYARQGHAAEALRVYRALAERQPGDTRLKNRIRELEARSTGGPRRLTYVAVDTGGESVESFFRSLAEARPGSGGAASGVDQGGPQPEDSSGAPTRPARDPLSLSAIFGEEPAAAAPAAEPEGPAPSKPPPGPDAFSFDQFFGGPTPSGQSSPPARPSGGSEEDLDQFQNWLKSLKR